ncbi:MAG: hypothetical protein HYZ38_20525 [Mycobacterium sp.]|nr:hypothetical protein [Mycobacterium sp.]
MVASVMQPSRGSTRVGIIAGWALIALMGAGFLLGGFVPPPGPYDAATTAAYFHENVDLKRFAVICLIVGGTMFIPFGAAVADRIRRVEGVGPVLAMCQLGAAIATAALMMVFGPMLLVGLQRPEMPDSTYQLLNHVAWMAWAGLWQPGALQAVVTAAAIFSEKSSVPVFPRWVAWYSLFMAFGSLTGSLIPFVTSGPFAWNGVIGFWVAAGVFFAWFAIMLIQFHIANRLSRSDITSQDSASRYETGDRSGATSTSIA